MIFFYNCWYNILWLEKYQFQPDSLLILLLLYTNYYWDARALAWILPPFLLYMLKRSGNAVANKLAKLAKYSHNPQIWNDDIPFDVQHLVLADKSFC